jgi:diguanylate cyclase (GGDEF)-like protein
MFDRTGNKKELLSSAKIIRYFFFVIPVYFLLFFYLIIKNFFPDISHFENVHFILVVFIFFFLIALIYLLYRHEEKKKLIIFYIYFSFFLITETAIQATGGISSIFYPLLYLLILVYVAVSPLKNSLFFLTMIILTESFMLLEQPKLNGHIFKFNTHIFFYLIFFVVFYLTLMYEKKQKDRYRLLLKTYEGLKQSEASILKGNKGMDIAALSEQGRKRHDISITHKLNDKIFEILQKLKDIMHPFTVMYLEIDEAEGKFFIKEVVSESDHINYNLEMGVRAGYLGWVVKNIRTLNVSNFENAIPDAFYYTADEMIKSLIIVPAIEGNKIKGVLLADSRELQYFSNKEENLMYLVAYQIMQEINNFKIMLKMEYNVKESAILNQLGKRLNASLNLPDTIQVMLSSISNLVKCDVIAAVFLTDDEKTCKINAVHGEAYENLTGRKFNMEDGICDFVIKRKKKVLFKDFTSVSNRKNIFDRNLKIKDIHTLLFLPLISNDVSFGAILIASKAPMKLSRYTVNTVETLVNQSATSIANAKMYYKMEMMATMDGLTGLFNHRCFQDKITDEMERLERYPESISVLLMDIDHFKKINDTYGHPVGDKVLRAIAEIFSGSLRKVDFAARYGGEEFVAILVNTDKKGAKKMGERIRRNIERKKFKIGDHEINITVSVGIATFPEDAKDKKGLINLADKALYFAKESGRNRCIHHQDIIKEA